MDHIIAIARSTFARIIYNLEVHPSKSSIILTLIICFAWMKSRGGLIYPLTTSGRNIIKLVKFALARYQLTRRWSIWNLFFLADHSIVLAGTIDGLEMEVIFTNEAMFDPDPIAHASMWFQSDVMKLFARKMTVIKSIKGVHTDFMCRDIITEKDLEGFLSNQSNPSSRQKQMRH